MALFDILTTAPYHGWCIAQKLRDAYTGPLVRVRRSSDNTEQDFYPAANSLVLDAAAVLAFVGAGDGYVSVAYDQSGNDNHVVNTNGNYAQLVIGGVLQVSNASPLASHLGATNQWVGQAHPMLTSLRGWAIGVHLTPNATGQFVSAVNYPAPPPRPQIGWGGGNEVYFYNEDLVFAAFSAPIAPGTKSVVLVTASGAGAGTATLAVNGTTHATFTAATPAYNAGVVWGGNYAGAQSQLGQTMFGLAYADYVAASDRELIEGWSAHLWGFAANLPEAHPYKSEPPAFGSGVPGAVRVVRRTVAPRLGVASVSVQPGV